MKVLIQKNIKITFLVVLLTNLFVLVMNLPSQKLFLELKMLLMKAIFKEYQYCKEKTL